VGDSWRKGIEGFDVRHRYIRIHKGNLHLYIVYPVEWLKIEYGDDQGGRKAVFGGM